MAHLMHLYNIQLAAILIFHTTVHLVAMEVLVEVVQLHQLSH